MAEHDRRMQVLGVGFPEFRLAQRAEAELRRVLDLGQADLSVDEVAGDPEFVDGAAVVMGGRIREHRLPLVREVIERHRGVVLTNVPERWMRWGEDASGPAARVTSRERSG